MPSQRDRTLNETLLDACVSSARVGAAYIQSRAQDLSTLDWREKSRTDFVSDVDTGAEGRIADSLLDAIPEAQVIGEELTPALAHGDGVTFIVDPLDGTTNFLHGYPPYAVSIAALADGELRAGVVLDVPRNATYTAIRGGGAFCDGAPIRVSGIAEPARALIGTGFPFKHADRVKPYLQQLDVIMPQVAGIRRAGAAAIDLADVAAGRFEAFWELMLAPWDIAAGMLLVREAGGRITDLQGADIVPTHTPVVASNGLMHGWVLQQLSADPQADRLIGSSAHRLMERK